MQLVSLHIKDRYNDLSNFKINFTDKLSLFVGVNGSGKSSVLEAIAKIVSWSNLIFIQGKKSKTDPTISPEFGFELIYLLRHETKIYETSTTSSFRTNYPLIKITGEKGNFKSVNLLIDEGNGFVAYETSAFYKESNGVLSKLLPANVIIYYSGVSESMHRLCNIHEEIFSSKLRDSETPELRALFYFTPQHFKYLLLSLFCFEYGPIPEFLNETIKISNVPDILIILKKPKWGKGSSSNFWGAKGRVSQFLNVLKDESKNTKSSKRDTILEIQISLDGLRKVREFFIEEKEIFRLFDIAHYDDLLLDINIELVHKLTNEPFDYKSLSEGEQQLITIKGLNEILIEDNSLALMDEPDSYLHPSRQRELMPEILERFNENCQVIATTHSPFVAQSVGIDKIKIFEPDENEPSPVDEDLLSYPGIAEGIFGIESEYSIELEQKIDSFKKIVSKIRGGKNFDKQQFVKLSEELASEGESINVAVSFELRKLKKEGLID